MMENIPPATIIFGVVCVVGLVVLIVLYKKHGVDCIFCQGKARFIDELPKSEYDGIKDYLAQQEGRNPTHGILVVCSECRKVKDDRILTYTARGLSMRCKSCDAYTVLDVKEMACSTCGTKHVWQSFEEYGGFSFLVPDATPDSEHSDEPLIGRDDLDLLS